MHLGVMLKRLAVVLLRIAFLHTFLFAVNPHLIFQLHSLKRTINWLYFYILVFFLPSRPESRRFMVEPLH